jgi:uncharacterized protein YfiM (DUF2279 family)
VKATTCSLALAAIGCYWSPVSAQTQDPWHGEDKTAHLVMIGGLPAYIVAVQAENAWAGFFTGVAFGAGKELLDSGSKSGIGPSGKDFVWTVAGAAIGASLGNWQISKERDTIVVTYTMRFK